VGTTFYRRHGKRLVDLLLTVPGLLLVSPLLLVLALCTRFFLGPPAFYRQRRPGRDGKPFLIFKFRTMLDLRGPDGRLLADEQRLTRFGAVVRATSLDELPELINVVRGEMSLVGPRPLLMQYLDRYTPEQARRHEVRPGITGWAQVNGRNLLSWDERFKLDVWYVDHCSIWLDVRILARTAWKVVKGEGIAAQGHVSMPEFMGPDEANGPADTKR
jgi:lipopolysaccharide/colanic/teichoic acid biosynthesis glycosyltransferase